MKFEIEFTRSDRRTVQVEAADRDAAYHQARKMEPGFRVEYVAVIAEEDSAEPAPEYGLNTTCEACGAPIWEGDEYHAGDDADLCAACAPTLADATA